MSTSSPTVQGNSVVLERCEAGVATLVLNRPDRLNALNNELAMALNAALERIASDENINVVVLTGAGRAFCAGGDLAVIGAGRATKNIASLEPLLRSGMRAVLQIRTMRQPVIAAVNGPAAGAGMNIALAADIRIASETATFGQNFAKIGLFPDYGGTYFLPQLIGPARAAEMFYTGDMIDAQAAMRLGLVNSVVAPGQLEAETKTLAEKISCGPAIAIRAVKHLLFGSEKAHLLKALEHEVAEQMKCFSTEDCGEGLSAFQQKRKPCFKGK